MTPAPDPIVALADQLAVCLEHLDELDVRDAAQHAELTGQLGQLAGMATKISRILAEGTVGLARLDALDRRVTELTRRLTGDDGDQRDDHGGNDGGYQPRPAPAWWKLPSDERRAPTAELRDWVEHVYRPGYGHLAASLSPCWPEHDLCLYGLDIASQLWCALYLQPARSTALLSAQAEYQVRVLPALAAQLAAETARCDRHPAGGYPRGTR
jgi:hypothetical protein